MKYLYSIYLVCRYLAPKQPNRQKLIQAFHIRSQTSCHQFHLSQTRQNAFKMHFVIVKNCSQVTSVSCLPLIRSCNQPIFIKPADILRTLRLSNRRNVAFVGISLTVEKNSWKYFQSLIWWTWTWTIQVGLGEGWEEDMRCWRAQFNLIRCQFYSD